MKIKIIKDARVLLKAGETANVSPEVAYQLMKLGKAIEAAPKKKKKKED